MIDTQSLTQSLRPSRWRYLSFHILVMCAAYQFGFTIFQIFSADLLGSPYPREAWLFSSVSFMVVYSIALLYSNRSLEADYSISLSGGMIEGPTNDRKRRTRFPLDRIDRERTRRTSWLNWVFLYRYIWSLDGERITILSYAYQQDQIQALLQQIGCFE